MPSLTIVVIIGGVFSLLLLIVGIVISVSSERTMVEERLGRYLKEDEAKIIGAGEQAAPTPLTDWITKQVEKSSFGDKIKKELARADLKLKPGEYIALMIILGFLVALIAWFIGGQSVIFSIIGAVVGALIPRFYIKSLQKRRLVRFNDQLPDMLNLMVNGLRAGFSTMQAMEAVSKELPTPICDEFRRVVQEMQLGLPMEKALENLMRRIPSEDLDLVITAINVQREVGGNLAEILDIISYTIRERIRIKGEIRVLTSQVMYSGRFLSMMPVFVALILWTLNRKYMMNFFENGLCGYAILGLCVVMIVIGYFVMNKLGDIEI
jgi:tight adherence protein B